MFKLKTKNIVNTLKIWKFSKTHELQQKGDRLLREGGAWRHMPRMYKYCSFIFKERFVLNCFRYYYKREILAPVLGRRLVYKFGRRSYGWESVWSIKPVKQCSTTASVQTVYNIGRTICNHYAIYYCQFKHC